MQLFKKMSGSLVATAIAATAMLVHPSPAMAQSYSNGYYGLADISYASGPTTIVRGDSGAQVAATINAPVAPGDYVVTGPGRAELQFDGSSMLRLASNTQVRLGSMAPSSREVQVANGTVDLAVLSGNSGNTQVDTPSVGVRPNQGGDYRVTVLGNGETLVTVRRGSATVSSSAGTQTLVPGETFDSFGNSVSTRNAVGFDSFDQFDSSRDQYEEDAYNASPYLSPQLAGYSDLANYGQWENVPGYGYAFAPNNQYQNYAPYQNGQWVWEPGYGYTWVDNSPYGYMTSHYGTWFNNPSYGGWLWQPPGYQYQSTSATLASAFLPAVVSFFLTGGNNGGSGFDATSLLGALAAGSLLNSNSYGNADIGWIPLAPGEVYQPWYGQNYSYPTTAYYTVPNVTNIYNYYTNARYYGGVTMVPVRSWHRGDFSNRIVPREGEIRRIALIRGAIPVVPTTSNLRFRTTVDARPVVLARTFSAPRLAARAPVSTRIAFNAQRTRMATVVQARPRVAAFRPTTARINRPVYHPVTARAQVHIAPLAPVRSIVRTAPRTQVRLMQPQHVNQALRHAQTMPAVHVQARQSVHVQAKPAVHVQQAKPVERVQKMTGPRAPIQRSVTHAVAPMQHQVTHAVAPVERPVVHQAAPVQRPVAPVERPAAPVQRPVVPVQRPVVPVQRPVAPVERPAAPVQRPVAPAERPITRTVAPAQKPAPAPKSEAKPKDQPTARPDRP